METRLRSAVGAAAFLLAAATASAQTTSGGASPGGGTTARTGDVDKHLDLPVGRPDRHGETKKPDDPPPPIDGDGKPPTFYGQEIKSETSTIYYVIDISGSMSWDVGQYTAPDGSTASGNRLDRAKAELEKSVSSLPENFKFDILAFDCSVEVWQPTMVPADAPHKTAAFGWIMALRPRGGTGTGPAVASALAVRDNKLVVLLTDGGPNCGAGDGRTDDATFEAHRTMIRAANTQNAVVNVFGINAYDRMKQFCLDVASDNGGTYTDVR